MVYYQPCYIGNCLLMEEAMPDPTRALFAFFEDKDRNVSFVWGRRFADLSDIEKLEVLNLAIEMLMEKQSDIIISLEVQRTSAAGQQKIQ